MKFKRYSVKSKLYKYYHSVQKMVDAVLMIGMRSCAV